ncbi:helix-turn-helix domain-containing protein [Streptomyces sp. NPDC021093]|uniref:helix-turn-helix domain-containing protein n=1 Tax=Streptomyces sp. NPDC021093 TaxID=3365112 RepID=UPI0037B49072
MSADPSRVLHLQQYLSQPAEPALIKRLVGTSLKDLREETGETQGQAAAALGLSTSTVCRIEKGLGRRPVKPAHVARLLQHYRADPAEAQMLMTLLDRAESAANSWWQRFGAAVLPGWLNRFIGLQETAALIRTYEVQLVPGLLQTEAYARAVVRAGLPMAQRAEVDERVSLRLGRQAMLWREGAPRLWAVMDEAVLHNAPGGPEVLREQLDYLLDVSERSEAGCTVTVQIAPFGSAAAVSPGMPFTYLRFPEQSVADVVYLEQVSGAEFVEDPEETLRYRVLLDHLAACALSPEDTRRRIRQVRDAL